MSRSSISAADEVAELEAEEDSPTVVVKDDLKTARIKGTWTMYWGLQTFDFENGKRYRIPADLYDYLKGAECIYDTL